MWKPIRCPTGQFNYDTNHPDITQPTGYYNTAHRLRAPSPKTALLLQMPITRHCSLFCHSGGRPYIYFLFYHDITAWLLKCCWIITASLWFECTRQQEDAMPVPPTISVTTTQLSHWGAKAATCNTHIKECGRVPTKLNWWILKLDFCVILCVIKHCSFDFRPPNYLKM